MEECLKQLQTGDVLLVWRLDRLGHSMVRLVKLLEDLGKKEIGFRSLCDGVIDTTTASGELIFNIFSSLAQFERRVIQERTRAGLDSARARGRKGGRPKKLNQDKRQLAVDLYQGKKHSIKQIYEMVGISKPTLYKYVDVNRRTYWEA